MAAELRHRHLPFLVSSSSSSFFLCSSLLLAFLACFGSVAMASSVYIVGGAAGWTTPSRANVNYTQWAEATTFVVGDTLAFNYVEKAHSVLEVTRTDFRYCNKSNPIVSHGSDGGKTRVVLSKPGNYYFIDGVGEHCQEGQKFQAQVAGSLAPAPSPSSPSSSAPAPATGAASPHAVPLPLTALLLLLFPALLHFPSCHI